MSKLARFLSSALGAALPTVLAPGCGGAEPDTHLEHTFDPCSGVAIATTNARPNEIAAIDAALELWNEAASLELARGEKADFPRLEITFERAASASRGLYDDERGVVLVNRAIDDSNVLEITIAHELGHAFGLWHVAPDERASLMNPDNRTIAPTAEDVAKLRSLWPSCNSLASR